jgi:DNA-binding CsgD family transcriptional regulator
MKETLKQMFFEPNRRPIIIISLLGAWIISFPYEGQLLYTMAKDYGIEYSQMLDISLIMQVIGLIIGGIFVTTTKIAKKILIFAIPICILCTVTFLFKSYSIWTITLTICATIAGVCITASGHFLRNCIKYDNRFRTAAELLINLFILKLIINNISVYISIQTGMAFTIILLGVAWLLILKMPTMQESKGTNNKFNKRAGITALLLLFLFVLIVSIDYGIMIQDVNPKYDSLGWLTNWYWLLPYIGSAFFMKSLRNTDDRSNILYIAVGMIGFGFIIFLLLDYSIISYLIVNTIMMGAWAISDVFWWSILGEMLEMVKNPAKIFSVGFSAVMIGVLLGKIIAGNDNAITEESLSIVSMAVICITLIILPMLHKLLSKMIKKNTPIPDITEVKKETLKFPDGVNTLTEREKQIVELLLKGRTYKLIAAELYLSENTIKTHVKNIYSKMGVKRKSELFNFMME